MGELGVDGKFTIDTSGVRLWIGLMLFRIRPKGRMLVLSLRVAERGRCLECLSDNQLLGVYIWFQYF